MSTATNKQIMISIVISSYNYDRFVSAAIDSALALDWPRVEVIVVDDGSTDNSPAIIRSYSSKVIAVFQKNAGRVNACNTGFKRARGDMVLFLDSDDMLHPDLVKEAARVWAPDVSKVQCQMSVVDAEGKPTGHIIPSFAVKPTPEHIRHWSSTTGGYPTPFGSGNIYSKLFLDQIFPLDASVWDSTDSCCLAAAPYFGAVETVDKPLVYYRVHGRNFVQMTEFDPATTFDVSHPRGMVIDAQRRFLYKRHIAAAKGIILAENVIQKNLAFATNRVVSCRFSPDQHPIANDTRWKIMADGIRASLSPQGVSVRSCVVQLLFIFVVGLAPLRAAIKLVLWRYVPSSRPSEVRNFLRLFAGI